MVSLGIPPHRITLTPSTVDNEWWSAKAAQVDRTTVRASWGVTENDVVFLFCAKLQPWKRPLDLLRAFAKVGQTNSLLVFAGEGPLRPQLEKEAAELRVASRVRFLGFVNQSQLPQIYKGVDLMVLPSSHENFGFVVNEAMCCGCPVAVSDQVGAGPDLVAPVNPGFIFPAGDVEALATLMSGVLSDPAQLREWSRRGLARMQTWSPECNIASTLEAVRIAVSRKRRDPTPPIPDFPSSQVAPAATRALKE
jgi:glycosyltransferase involved in cell wall biosynthesis